MLQPHVTRTSDRDDYCTPIELFEKVDAVFHFTLDAAAQVHNALCDTWLSHALTQPWLRDYSVWCNPPFSNKEAFLRRASVYRNCNRVIVFLLPNNARESAWWRELVWKQADEIVTLTPRVNFVLDRKPAKGVAFGSCLVVYYPRIPGCEYGAPRESVWKWKSNGGEG